MKPLLQTLAPQLRGLLLVGCCGLLLACQVTPPYTGAPAPAPAMELPEAEDQAAREIQVTPAAPVQHTSLWHRLQSGFELQEHFEQEQVERRTAPYQDNQQLINLTVQRAAPFLHGILEQVEARGLPAELALLPAVESDFKPDAASGRGAAGLWQFVSGTAQRYGLQQDWWYDGRYDPMAATGAALDYLQVLYEDFNQDWLLALAAYNTGAGNLRRAIRRSGQDPEGEVDFWSLPLAAETRAHVPRLLALCRVLAAPDTHGIELPPLANSPALQRVEVGTQIELARAARLAQLDYGELRRLNAGYRQWATHPQSPQHLYLPEAAAARLQSALTASAGEELLVWERYQIQPGDTLVALARRFATPIEVLQTANGLTGSRIIAGDTLLIPSGTGDLSLVSSALPAGFTASATNSRSNIYVPGLYTVKAGDSLWRIGQRFGTSAREIARHNGIGVDTLLHPGQKLNLSFAQRGAAAGASAILVGPYYRVQPGDTVQEIAQRFEASLEELLLWNNIKPGDIIYPEQNIRVLPPADKTTDYD